MPTPKAPQSRVPTEKEVQEIIATLLERHPMDADLQQRINAHVYSAQRVAEVIGRRINKRAGKTPELDPIDLALVHAALRIHDAAKGADYAEEGDATGHHAELAAREAERRGFHDLADVIRRSYSRNPDDEPLTPEHQLVCYADWRGSGSGHVVTPLRRLQGMVERHKLGEPTAEMQTSYDAIRRYEQHLAKHGVSTRVYNTPLSVVRGALKRGKWTPMRQLKELPEPRPRER